MIVGELRIGDWFLHHEEKYLIIKKPMTSEVLVGALRYTPEGMYRCYSSIGSGVTVEYLGSNISEVFSGQPQLHL